MLPPFPVQKIKLADFRFWSHFQSNTIVALVKPGVSYLDRYRNTRVLSTKGINDMVILANMLKRIGFNPITCYSSMQIWQNESAAFFHNVWYPGNIQYDKRLDSIRSEGMDVEYKSSTVQRVCELLAVKAEAHKGHMFSMVLDPYTMNVVLWYLTHYEPWYPVQPNIPPHDGILYNSLTNKNIVIQEAEALIMALNHNKAIVGLART